MANNKSRNINIDAESIAQNTPADSGRKNGVIVYLKGNLWLVGVVGFLAVGTLGATLKYLDEQAQRELTKRLNQRSHIDYQREQSFLNKINPFLPPPTATPLPTSKEYIYAGSRTLAVVDANANEIPPADLAIWRPGDGNWWVMSGNGSQQVTQQWGLAGDIPVPGDYDGDGKTDFAVFRSSNSNWYLIFSSTGGTTQFGFGTGGDKPVPADYDGDGKTDVAVFRNSNTTWYVNYSSTSVTHAGVYGSAGDIPAPADFDGDGRADLAVFRESNTTFYSLNSANLQTQNTSIGASGDKPVSADYDGDGKADVALWRSSNATWYFKYSSDGSTASVQFGIATDTPVPNDYDGNSKCDIAVWRGVASSSPGGDVGKWFIRNSSNPATPRVEQWGMAGDIPVPAFWKR